MKELRILWQLFGFIEMQKAELIQEHLNKFWKFYELDLGSKKNFRDFYQMFCFLKKNAANTDMVYEFFIKINKIKNYELIFEIYESIFSKVITDEFYLMNKEKNGILKFLIKFPFDKYNKFSSDANIYF